MTVLSDVEDNFFFILQNRHSSSSVSLVQSLSAYMDKGNLPVPSDHSQETAQETGLVEARQNALLYTFVPTKLSY